MLESKVKEFLMRNGALEKFEESVLIVFTEGGWEQAEADSALTWIKEKLGIPAMVAVKSGV